MGWTKESITTDFTVPLHFLVILVEQGTPVSSDFWAELYHIHIWSATPDKLGHQS